MKKLSLIVTTCLLLAAQSSHAQQRQKVVYHVTDADKVPFVIGNIENHIKGVGGPENVEIILVAHGPAVKAFEKKEAAAPILTRINSLNSSGVEFNACGNTLNKNGSQLSDLAEGFVRVDQGGVVRIVELQSQGYIYIRP